VQQRRRCGRILSGNSRLSRTDTHLGDAVATGRASEAVFDELHKEEVVEKGLAEQLADVDPADAGCFGGEGRDCTVVYPRLEL
jgi:hypothetical protein